MISNFHKVNWGQKQKDMTTNLPSIWRPEGQFIWCKQILASVEDGFCWEDLRGNLFLKLVQKEPSDSRVEVRREI